MSVKSAIAIINGQQYTLTYNAQTKNYEATITAPAKSSYTLSGHYYPVTVKATDLAGNSVTVNDTDSTLGASCHLQVKEKVAPASKITAPTSGALTANNKPTITWTITDDDSGVNPDTITLSIDGTKVTAAFTKTVITGGYSCSYTPGTALADGAHTITVGASDYDGNKATDVSVSFRVLATAPVLSITSPEDGTWFNKAAVSFAGTTDAKSLTVKVGSGTAQNVTITNGTFSGNLTLTAEGSNTVTFVATSESGVTTTITRKLNLDTHAPVIDSITLTPNPVDAGKTFVLSVHVTD